MQPKIFTVQSFGQDQTLLDALADHLSLSRKRAKALLDQRVVFVNQKRVWMARHTLRSGDTVEVHLPAPTNRSAELDILFRDARVVIINKPANLVSNGPGSAESRLRRQLADPKLAAVHRLDKDTTGCNLFARNQEAWQEFSDAFRKRQVGKRYLALVRGVPTFDRETVSLRLDGKTATTHVQVQKRFNASALVELDLETGRNHQIRRHLAHIGFPVLGDTHYGKQQTVPDERVRHVVRIMLHASGLQVQTGHAPVTATAPLPADMKRAIRDLRRSDR